METISLNTTKAVAKCFWSLASSYILHYHAPDDLGGSEIDVEKLVCLLSFDDEPTDIAGEPHVRFDFCFDDNSIKARKPKLLFNFIKRNLTTLLQNSDAYGMHAISVIDKVVANSQYMLHRPNTDDFGPEFHARMIRFSETIASNLYINDNDRPVLYYSENKDTGQFVSELMLFWKYAWLACMMHISGLEIQERISNLDKENTLFS